jgi:hypothetical protein
MRQRLYLQVANGKLQVASCKLPPLRGAVQTCTLHPAPCSLQLLALCLVLSLFSLPARSGPGPAAKSNIIAEPTIPKSVFDDKGRDPFFPNRVDKPQQTTPTPVPVAILSVDLIGITPGLNSAKTRVKLRVERSHDILAEEGDNHSMKLWGKEHHIKVLSIQEDADVVVLEVDGERREVKKLLPRHSS